MSITQLPADVAARYKLVHDALSEIAGQARRKSYSRFTVINRKALQTARQHLNVIENRDGDELVTALAKAQAWLESKS